MTSAITLSLQYISAALIAGENTPSFLEIASLFTNLLRHLFSLFGVVCLAFPSATSTIRLTAIEGEEFECTLIVRMES